MSLGAQGLGGSELIPVTVGVGVLASSPTYHGTGAACGPKDSIVIENFAAGLRETRGRWKVERLDRGRSESWASNVVWQRAKYCACATASRPYVGSAEAWGTAPTGAAATAGTGNHVPLPASSVGPLLYELYPWVN